MKKVLLAGVSLAAIGFSNAAYAADPCPYGGDPYKNYNCLDSYLGTDFMSRFINEVGLVFIVLLLGNAPPGRPELALLPEW